MTIHGVGQLDPVTQQVATLLENLGVVFPGPVDPAIDKTFPADLTAVSLLELGEHHSYWSAQYARLTTVHGVVTAQKRSLKHQIQELKRLPQPMLTEPVERKLRELGHQLARVDAADAILGGTCDAHKRYVEACSREVTRRQTEAHLSR